MSEWIGKTLPVGFIGVGNMASAIISGIIKEKRYLPSQIGVYDIDSGKLDGLGRDGHPVFDTIPHLVECCRYVVLAVKPQTFPIVLEQVKKAVSMEKVLVSIAAGISAEYIKKSLGIDCKIVLAMPNTPLLLGCGATALSRVEPTDEKEFAKACELFSCAGIAEEVAADKMNEVIPVNGSSPAFLYLFAKSVADWAQGAGIPWETALRLFCQTMKGSAEMMLNSGKGPQELIDMVCSPGGTTLAAMAALEQSGFADSVQSAANACVQRAMELSKGK